MCVFRKLIWYELLDYSPWIKLDLNQAIEAGSPGFAFWCHYFLTTRSEASYKLLGVLSNVYVLILL